MCLAVPMKIVEVSDGATGVCDLDGARHAVNFSLIDNPRDGDLVIVHAGYAIEKLDVHEANERLALFDELAALSP
jgi:hydrogenase expression/formation protein HypC